MEVSWVADQETLRSILDLIGRDPKFDPPVIVGYAKRIVNELWLARSEMAVDRIDGVASLALREKLETEISRLRNNHSRVVAVDWKIMSGTITGIGRVEGQDVVSCRVEVEGSMVDVGEDDHPIPGTHIGPESTELLLLSRPFGTLSTEWHEELCQRCGRARPEEERLRSCPFCGVKSLGIGGWLATEWRKEILDISIDRRAGPIDNDSRRLIDQATLRELIPGFSERDFIGEARNMYYALVASRVDGTTSRVSGRITRAIEGSLVQEAKALGLAHRQIVKVVEIQEVRVVAATKGDNPVIRLRFTVKGIEYLRDKTTELPVEGDSSTRTWDEEFDFTWDGSHWLVTSAVNDYVGSSVSSILAERAARRAATGSRLTLGQRVTRHSASHPLSVSQATSPAPVSVPDQT